MTYKANFQETKNSEASLPQVFKGIALFTPGGDLIYCIDPSKHSRWHLHLCAVLQERLGLPEPPHFLVPGYTATIDRWIDPYTKELRISAEAHAPVLRHQALLNAVFNAGDLAWQVAPWLEQLCNPMVLATYRSQFPQLWEDHDLVMRVERTGVDFPPSVEPVVFTPERAEPQGYILRLFVGKNTAATERTLERLHQLLERALSCPYTLKVIDIFKHPEQAEADQVSATPTLVKVWPRPVRRIVGELENIGEILRVLGNLDG